MLYWPQAVVVHWPFAGALVVGCCCCFQPVVLCYQSLPGTGSHRLQHYRPAPCFQSLTHLQCCSPDSGWKNAAGHHAGHAVMAGVVAACYCHCLELLAWPLRVWVPVLTRPAALESPSLEPPALVLAVTVCGYRQAAVADWWIVRMMAGRLYGGYPVVACVGYLHCDYRHVPGFVARVAVPFSWVQVLPVPRQRRTVRQTGVLTGLVLRVFQPLYSARVTVRVQAPSV